MAYTAWSVVANEQPSTAKWNILGANDASFADGTGIAVDVIANSKLKYGMIRNRQGGTAGDATWANAGTTTVATDAKDTFIQVGALTVTGGATTLTFPTAFTYAPVILGTATTASSANVYVRFNAVSATNCNVAVYDATGATGTETVSWIAIGQ